MIEIIPSILVKTERKFIEKLRAVEPYVTRVHLDIADGIFVPNTTIEGIKELQDLQTNLKIEVHLMVSRPENHIGRWLKTCADKFIFHIEATDKTREIIGAIQDGGKLAALTLNPETENEKVIPFVDEIDYVQFMAVKPGFYGSVFEKSVIEKIRDFHYLYPDKTIQADGGVTPETVPKLSQAGASSLVSGSYIWKSGNEGNAIEELHDSSE